MLIDSPTAKLHLRVDGNDEDTILAVYIGAAEAAAVEFLNRAVFADQGSLDAALGGVTATLVAAGNAHRAALVAAWEIEDLTARAAAEAYANDVYVRAYRAAQETRAGMVINPAVQAAILLTIGHLYTNREEVVVGASVAQLPQGARQLLQPYRVGLGV